MKRTVFILLLLIFIAANLPSQPMSIGYFQTDQRYEYRIELLRLALDKTLEADGSYVLIPISEGRDVDPGPRSPLSEGGS